MRVCFINTKAATKAREADKRIGVYKRRHCDDVDDDDDDRGVCRTKYANECIGGRIRMCTSSLSSLLTRCVRIMEALRGGKNYCLNVCVWTTENRRRRRCCDNENTRSCHVEPIIMYIEIQSDCIRLCRLSIRDYIILEYNRVRVYKCKSADRCFVFEKFC